MVGNAEDLKDVPDDTYDAYTIAFGIRNCTNVDKVNCCFCTAHFFCRGLVSDTGDFGNQKIGDFKKREFSF